MTQFLETYLQETEKENQSTATISFLAGLDHVSSVCSSAAEATISELKDQRSHLKMIASENYSSLATQQAMGTLLTDKYAEGYPHHRFYAGCENVDAIEEKACSLLQEIYGAEHAYVQPHSGADANLVAFWAILMEKIQKPMLESLGNKKVEEISLEEHEKIRKKIYNQKLLGMALGSGGHLTHGFRHNASSKMFEAHNYNIDPKTGLLDYEAIREQAKSVRPLILLVGYSAYPRRINFAIMREIADEVGAVLLVDMAHFSGLVAGKVFTAEYNPVPYADIVTSTSHKTLRGPRGGFVLCKKEWAEAVNKGCPHVLGGPLPHVIAAKAVAFTEANLPSFQDYAHQVVENAQALAASLQENNIPVLTGGTDNHIVLFDCRPFGLTGRQVEKLLREAKITCNRNAIPFDPNGTWYTSGIRLGTPAITTLGMGKEQMRVIGTTIAKLLQAGKPTTKKDGNPSLANYTIDEKVLQEAKVTIDALLKNYPLYPEIQLKTLPEN